MIISLDYDKTYTADPETWDKVVAIMKESGHEVVVITARPKTASNQKEVKVAGCKVYFTDYQSKVKFAKDEGLAVDIWIDDSPFVVCHGVPNKVKKSASFGQIARNAKVFISSNVRKIWNERNT